MGIPQAVNCRRQPHGPGWTEQVSPGPHKRPTKPLEEGEVWVPAPQATWAQPQAGSIPSSAALPSTLFQGAGLPQERAHPSGGGSEGNRDMDQVGSCSGWTLPACPGHRHAVPHFQNRPLHAKDASALCTPSGGLLNVAAPLELPQAGVRATSTYWCTDFTKKLALPCISPHCFCLLSHPLTQ